MPINTMAMQAPYTDYGQELEELQRRQRYAEMLREQSMQAPQPPETKGRLSAPTHWTQLAAGLLKNASALSQQQEGHKERKALSQRYQDESQKNLAAALMKARGTPMQATEDAAGNVDVQQQAVKPDIPGAGMDLMRNPNPMMQQMGAGALGPVFNPPKPKFGHAPAGSAIINEGTGQVTGNVPAAPRTPTTDKSIPADWAKFLPAGAKPNPNYPAGVFAMPGPDGKPDLYEFQFENGRPTGAKKLDSSPRVTVTTPVTVSTEKKYGEHFASALAASDVALRDAATKAPELADRANRIKQVLASGNVITGTAADFRLQFAKAAKLAGITQSDSPENTETLAASLAQNTMDAIKASGLGGGTGFSNADRDFLEKAVGGRITLEPQAIGRLADLSHRAASLATQRWNTRVKSIPKSALEGTGVTQDPINTPPLFTGGNVSPQQQPAPPGVRPELWDVMTPEQRALWQTPQPR